MIVYHRVECQDCEKIYKAIAKFCARGLYDPFGMEWVIGILEGHIQTAHPATGTPWLP